MTTQGTLRWVEWKGFNAYDRDGQKIGSIDEIWLYANEWGGRVRILGG